MIFWMLGVAIFILAIIIPFFVREAPLVSEINIMIFWTMWGLVLTLVLIIPFFIGWLFWFPLRLFLFSLIPLHAAYAWIGKLIIIIMIGCFGGIGIPLVLFFFGMMVVGMMLSSKF